MKEEGRAQGVSKPSHRLQKMSCWRGEYRTLFVRNALSGEAVFSALHTRQTARGTVLEELIFSHLVKKFSALL